MAKRGSFLVLGLAVLAGCTSAPRPVAIHPTPSGPPTCGAVFNLRHYSAPLVAQERSDGRCLAEELTLSGDVRVRISDGLVDSQDLSGSVCATPSRGDTWPAAHLTIAADDKVYHLTISPPGAYDRAALDADATGAVELQRIDAYGIGNQEADWHSTSGRLTVDVNAMQGTVDADMKATANLPAVHVEGTWRCGAPAPSAAVDATIPCNAYYLAAGKSADDIAGLKAASACLPQDITASGGLGFHVGEAVNDGSLHFTAVPTGQCGGLLAGDPYNYASTIDFAVDGETFHLAFDVSHDRGDGPLPFPDFGPTVSTSLGDLRTVYLIAGKVEWTASAGKFSVSADHHSGTVDMELAEEGTVNGGKAVHLSGSWRCAP